ncbi:MAG TPA: hypothetical protein VHN56_04500 [Actinomycetota bacterium]|nr:hypothetical protein [Actinomycetota bacterium]
MQRPILGLIVMLAALSCTGVSARTPDLEQPAIQIRPTGSPYVRVTAGSVSGLVPHGWQAVPMDGNDFHEGFVASPHPDTWPEMRPSTAGLVATWVDATRVGVPSDLYYLAASGPLLSDLRDRAGCTSSFEKVLVDNVPAFLHGAADSPGDFVARGGGVCRSDGGAATRWSYFVAAPGFGPVGRIGIPGSGLYVIVAATRESPRARRILSRLLDHVRFGRDGIGDFVRALKPPMAL